MSEASPSRRRVLVIDDMESIHDAFRKILMPPAPSSSFAAAKNALFGTSRTTAPPNQSQHRFEVDFAFQGRDGVRMVRQARESGDPYLVAFVDMRMPPGWDGSTTIKHLWEVDPDLQIVVCTAFSDQPLETLAKELGRAHQLLIVAKPFDSIEVLQAAKTLSEKRIAQQAASIQTEELQRLVRERTTEIEHAMLHDKLTGLPNRTMLMNRLGACFERRKRNPDHRFAVLFLDFDRFKLVNDSLGHELGDRLLQEIGERLHAGLRGHDLPIQSSLPSRLGGDEFIVLLEELKGEHDAARVAERLIQQLSEPYELNEQKLVVTVSIGIATSDRGYDNPGDMLRDADTAMYRAKAAGRARFVMFDEIMHAEVSERLVLETAIRNAVRADELRLHYQPITSLEDGALIGFESLLRWSLPDRGPIPPTKIVSIAEETGLIHPMTLNLLHQACKQLRSWQDRHPQARSLLMGINFSRRLVLDPRIVDEVDAILQQSGVRPENIVLEITENALLTDRDAAIDLFQRLRGLGVWLHLDDFGIGYSSLSCLYRIPLSGIKIDRIFLCEAGTHPQQRAILKAVVGIADALHLKVIVEGIETTEQLDLVRSLGIQMGQGYLIGAPCEPASAEAVFHDKPTLCHA